MPIIQVKDGPRIRFPDSMSQEEIQSALNEMTDRGEFGGTPQPKKPAEDIGVMDLAARAGRNVFNAPIDLAASLIEVPAVIGEFARNAIPFLNDSAPFQDMALHKAAEWVRGLEMSHGDQQRPEGVAGFVTDTLPGMVGTMGTVALAAGAAEAAIPVGIGAALIMAGSQGVNAFKQARDAGADDSQQFAAWLVNSGIGAASAIPISRWLNAQPNKDLLQMGLKEGSINAVTAFFQQLATNAADKAIWDKERPWFEGVAENTAAGLTVGGLMGLALAGTAKAPNRKASGKINDPELNAAAQNAKTSNASETASALAETDSIQAGKTAEATLDPITQDPSHVVSPEAQTVLHEEQLKLDREQNGFIEEPVKPNEATKVVDEPTKPIEGQAKPEGLTEEEKAAIKAELDAELNGEEIPLPKVEEIKPIEEPKVEGRQVPTETNHILKKVNGEIARLNKLFGGLIDNVVVQDIPEGAGIASAARAGEHRTIALDPVRLAESEKSGASIKDLVREEVIHSLQGKAVRDMWTKLGEPGEFRDYWDKHFTELANEMSDAQKEWINKIYGSELKSPIQQAVEFVRAILQERYSGRISEAGYSRAKQPALTNLLNVFKEFWNGMKGKRGEVGKLAKQQMQAIDNLLREGKKNARRSKSAEPKPVEPTAKPAEPAVEPNGSKPVLLDVEKDGQSAKTEATPSDVSESRAGGSSPESVRNVSETIEPTKQPDLTLSEEHHQNLYKAASDAVDRAGLDDVSREFAFDYIYSRLVNKAEAYVKENGSLDKFSGSRVTNGLLKDFYKHNGRQKRAGEKVSLDAPLGDEGEASVGDTISAGDTVQGDMSEGQKRVQIVQEAIKGLPKEAQDLLNARMGEHGAIAKLAKELKIPENTLRSRIKVAEKQLARALLGTPEGRELFAPEDLVNAARPSDNPLLPDEWDKPLARELDPWTKFKRFLSPDRWAYEGQLTELANTTENPRARGLLMTVGKRITRYYDKIKDVQSKTVGKIYEVLNTVKDKTEEESLKREWEIFHAAHESRDGGITAQQAHDDAMNRVYPTLSPKAKALVDHRMANGVWSGQFQNGLNGGIGLIVKDGKEYRVFSDAGSKFYPRQLSQEIDMVLGDPDAVVNRARFNQLMDELVNNNPDQFPSVIEAEAFWKERGRNSVTSGNYYAGADMARGVKLPDSWHDYSLEGYLKGRERWAERVSQIWAFGQDAPAEIVKGKVVRPALMNIFDEAIKFATAQSNNVDGGAALKTVLGQIRDDVFGTRQSHAGDNWVRDLRSFGTIRYLSAALSSFRNVLQAGVSTAEQAGFRNALMASSKGLYDASRAIYKSAKAGRFIEPDQVEAAGHIGAFQRSVTHQSFYDLDPVKPAGTAVGKAGQWVGEKLLLGQHLSEGWNRGMSAAAFGLWSRDAVRAFAHNPNSHAVLKARALLQRWGFGLPEQARFFAGETEMVNRFIRVAVNEKQYGYKGDQVPALFRSPSVQLLTLFQSWGVQRTRDFTRNVWRPMFYGDNVNLPGGRTARVRDPMPMIRFIVGSMAGTATLNLLKDQALGRKLKDPSWEEIMLAGDEDTQHGVMMALGRVVNDLTASGGMGLVPDYMRAIKDWTAQGRSKSLANSPALQIASDLTDFLKAQVGREGDPKAFWRDFRDILLLRTPIAKEVNDFSTHMLLFGEDAKTLFDARQSISMGRALLKRWTNETGRDNLLKRHSFTGDKTPNSEMYDQIYENILEGDTVRAGELVNEFTNDRKDRKKLASVQASIRGRTPLAGEARLTPQEMQEFISWASRRNPEAGQKIDTIIKAYHSNVNKLGFR